MSSKRPVRAGGRALAVIPPTPRVFDVEPYAPDDDGCVTAPPTNAPGVAPVTYNRNTVGFSATNGTVLSAQGTRVPPGPEHSGRVDMQNWIACVASIRAIVSM